MPQIKSPEIEVFTSLGEAEEYAASNGLEVLSYDQLDDHIFDVEFIEPAVDDTDDIEWGDFSEIPFEQLLEDCD